MVSTHSPPIRLATTLAGVLLPLLLASGAHAAEGPAPVSVPTLVVGGGSSSTSLDIEGTLQALQQSTVAAQVGGNVLQLAVKAGDRVKACLLYTSPSPRD